MPTSYSMIQCAYKARTFEYEKARASLSQELDLKRKTDLLDALAHSGGPVDKVEYQRVAQEWEAARKELDDRLDLQFPDLKDCYDPLTWFGNAKKVYGAEAVSSKVDPQPLMVKVIKEAKLVLRSFVVFYRPLFRHESNGPSAA